jgi:hypothetical protein
VTARKNSTHTTISKVPQTGISSRPKSGLSSSMIMEKSPNMDKINAGSSNANKLSRTITKKNSYVGETNTTGINK